MSSPYDPRLLPGRCVQCGVPVKWTWYCLKHYLEKEAGYALYDIKNNRDNSLLMEMAFRRLLALAEYRQSQQVAA